MVCQAPEKEYRNEILKIVILFDWNMHIGVKNGK